MDRGTWWATAHGIARVGHNLVLSFFLSTFSWEEQAISALAREMTSW